MDSKGGLQQDGHSMGLSPVSTSPAFWAFFNSAFQLDHVDAQQTWQPRHQKQTAASSKSAETLCTCSARTEAFRAPELLALSHHVVLTAHHVGASKSIQKLLTAHHVCAPPQSQPAAALTRCPAACPVPSGRLLLCPEPSRGSASESKPRPCPCPQGPHPSCECYAHRPPAWPPQDLCTWHLCSRSL